MDVYNLFVSLFDNDYSLSLSAADISNKLRQRNRIDSPQYVDIQASSTRNIWELCVQRPANIAIISKIPAIESFSVPIVRAKKRSELTPEMKIFDNNDMTSSIEDVQPTPKHQGTPTVGTNPAVNGQSRHDSTSPSTSASSSQKCGGDDDVTVVVGSETRYRLRKQVQRHRAPQFWRCLPCRRAFSFLVFVCLALSWIVWKLEIVLILSCSQCSQWIYLFEVLCVAWRAWCVCSLMRFDSIRR